MPAHRHAPDGRRLRRPPVGGPPRAGDRRRPGAVGRFVARIAISAGRPQPNFLQRLVDQRSARSVATVRTFIEGFLPAGPPCPPKAICPLRTPSFGASLLPPQPPARRPGLCYREFFVVTTGGRRLKPRAATSATTTALTIPRASFSPVSPCRPAFPWSKARVAAAVSASLCALALARTRPQWPV